MVCRGMDAESCPNDGTKMHNVNFTKNDVRKVKIVRFLTFLNANFHTSGKIGRGDFFLSKITKNDSKIIKRRIERIKRMIFFYVHES